MRVWVGLLLCVGCTPRALFVSDTPTSPADLATPSADLAVTSVDLAVTSVDLATPIDLATPVDLATPADLAPQLSWHAVAVPTGEGVVDISGWSSAVLVATETYDETSAPAAWVHGAVRSFDGQNWTTLLDVNPGDPYEGGFNSVYAISSTEYYATIPSYARSDHTGLVLASDGQTWSEAYSSTTDYFVSLNRLQSGELVVVGWQPGEGGTVAVRQSGVWNRLLATGATDFAGVWGTSATDFYATGWPSAIFHYTQAGWQDVSSGALERDFFAWGTGSVLYIGGPDIALYDDGTLNDVVAGNVYFYDLWAVASDRAYAVGCTTSAGDCTSALVYYFDGAEWTSMAAPPERAAYKIWGRSDSDIWVGAEGKLYHYSL